MRIHLRSLWAFFAFLELPLKMDWQPSNNSSPMLPGSLSRAQLNDLSRNVFFLNVLSSVHLPTKRHCGGGLDMFLRPPTGSACYRTSHRPGLLCLSLEKLGFEILGGLTLYSSRQFKQRESPQAPYIYSYSENTSKLKCSLSERPAFLQYYYFGVRHV